MSLPLLQVKDISYTYHTKAGETPALSHISFSVFPGEFIAIVGPSGCGKSTFLDMLCGLLKPAAGELLKRNSFIHVQYQYRLYAAKRPFI